MISFRQWTRENRELIRLAMPLLETIGRLIQAAADGHRIVVEVKKRSADGVQYLDIVSVDALEKVKQTGGKIEEARDRVKARAKKKTSAKKTAAKKVSK